MTPDQKQSQLMFRRQLPTSLILLGLALIAVTSLLFSRPAQVAPGPPLSKDEVVKMLKNYVSPKVVAEYARTRGIDFEVTPEVERALREAGADDTFLSVLREVARKPVAPATPQQAAERPVGPAPGAQAVRFQKPVLDRNLSGVNGEVVSMRFSPDGSKLAAASADTVLIWDSASGAELQRISLSGTSAVPTMTFSRALDLLALVSQNNTDEVRDVKTGQVSRTFERRAVSSIAFSFDAKSVAFGDDFGGIEVFQTATAQELNVLHGPNAAVSCVALSHDGRLLASGSATATVLLWDVGTGSELKAFSGSGGSCLAVAFVHEDQWLAAVFTGNIRLWEVSTGQELPPMDLATGRRFDVASVSPNGQLVAASSGTRVGVWNTATGGLTADFSDVQVNSMAFSPDGRFLAVGRLNGKVGLWRGSN